MAWFQAHAAEVYPQHRGKHLCIAAETLFVGDTPEEAWARATAAHPEDDGRFLSLRASGGLGAESMRINGQWFLSADGISRPVMPAHLRTGNGAWIAAPFLVDTGADRTVLSAGVLAILHLPHLVAPAAGWRGGCRRLRAPRHATPLAPGGRASCHGAGALCRAYRSSGPGYERLRT